MNEPESALPGPSQEAMRRSNACHEIMEGDQFLLISSSKGDFSVSRHINPRDYPRYICYLEVVKAEMVDAIRGSETIEEDDG